MFHLAVAVVEDNKEPVEVGMTVVVVDLDIVQQILLVVADFDFDFDFDVGFDFGPLHRILSGESVRYVQRYSGYP